MSYVQGGRRPRYGSGIPEKETTRGCRRDHRVIILPAHQGLRFVRPFDYVSYAITEIYHTEDTEEEVQQHGANILRLRQEPETMLPRRGSQLLGHSTQGSGLAAVDWQEDPLFLPYQGFPVLDRTWRNAEPAARDYEGSLSANPQSAGTRWMTSCCKSGGGKRDLMRRRLTLIQTPPEIPSR